jgi:hypothetical protein
MLAAALPPVEEEPARPTDVLEEVVDEDDTRAHAKAEDDDDTPRPRRRSKKKRSAEYRTPLFAQPTSPGWWTRDRFIGAVGVGLGTCMLLGTCAHHVVGQTTGSAWVVCCGDVFALALVGVGLYYLFLKG